MNKLVVASLSGGLGNQLFQYAAARAISLRNNCKLVLDLAWFSETQFGLGVTPRSYSLDPFELPVLVKRKLNLWSVSRFTSFLISFKNAASRFSKNIYSEKSYNFDSRVLALRVPVRLKGYWQSHRYFEDFSECIKSEIGTIRKLSHESAQILDKIVKSNSICLHIRRGDYVSNLNASTFHGVCSMDYYRRGLEIVSDGLDLPHAFVFTDDPDWAKEHLDIGVKFTVVDVNGPDDAYQDLWLMSSCDRFVIANSSLSWWGAWLSRSPDKVVVAPKQWFASMEIDTSDLIPSDWIRV